VRLHGHPNYNGLATGWLVRDDLVVTNRHVADVFVYRSGNKIVKRLNPEGETIEASIDFRSEHEGRERSEFPVLEVIHIEPEDGPDVALLRLKSQPSFGAGNLARPIQLLEQPVVSAQAVAAIGYPAWGGHSKDPKVMERLFNNIYGVKRLSPGEVLQPGTRYFTHDCTTLGGNSGSVILDLNTGHAAGLHYAGWYGKQNYAVPAPVIIALLRRLGL
jgi:V8-like Glu-specific endopeptidase